MVIEAMVKSQWNSYVCIQMLPEVHAKAIHQKSQSKALEMRHLVSLLCVYVADILMEMELTISCRLHAWVVASHFILSEQLKAS